MKSWIRTLGLPFKNWRVIYASVMLDYIAVIFIIYTVVRFLGDFTCRIIRKIEFFPHFYNGTLLYKGYQNGMTPYRGKWLLEFFVSKIQLDPKPTILLSQSETDNSNSTTPDLNPTYANLKYSNPNRNWNKMNLYFYRIMEK